MLKIERKLEIIKLIRKLKIVQVKKLAIQLGVTKETVRADLAELENEGLVKRFHGGAMLNTDVFETVSLQHLLDYPNIDFERFNNLNKVNQMNNDVFILGSFNVDITSSVPYLPAPGESILATNLSFSPGGKGANQALAACYAEAVTYFATKIGKDEFNDYAKRHFTNSIINNYYLFESEKSKTGCAVILVSSESGENVISISPGANMEISHTEVNSLEFDIRNSKILLLQLETNIDAIKSAIDIAKTSDTKIILNPAPYNETVTSLLSLVDIITPNETEASAISNIEIVDLDTAKQAAKRIHDMGVSIVIITLGSKGALCFDGQQYIYMPSYPSIVKNTSGAGDAFNGALASALAKENTLIYSLQYAAAFASLAVETDSASGMPLHQVVLDRLNKHINTIYPKTFI